jgi:hypothetical protein
MPDQLCAESSQFAKVPRGLVDPSEQTGKDDAQCENYQTPSRHAGHMPTVSIEDEVLQLFDKYIEKRTDKIETKETDAQDKRAYYRIC